VSVLGVHLCEVRASSQALCKDSFENVVVDHLGLLGRVEPGVY
jgi:hypothetical protein